MYMYMYMYIIAYICIYVYVHVHVYIDLLQIVQRIYGSIISLHPPNLNRVGIHKPSKLITTAGLTEVRGVAGGVANHIFIIIIIIIV